MSARVAIAPGLVVGWLAASACSRPDVFECSDHMQCIRGALQGTCEINGYCSFPDASCDSGHRYGDRAPVGIANACVAPQDAVTTMPPADDDVGDDIGDDGSADDDAPSSTTTPVDPDAGPGADTSTDGVGPSTDPTSDDMGPTSGQDTQSDTESDTGPPPDTCSIAFVDEFDDGQLGPPVWWPWQDAGVTILEQAGRLVITFAGSNDWIGAGAWTEPVPMAGGWAKIEIAEYADPDIVASVGVVLNSNHCDLQLEISQGEVVAYTRIDDEFTAVAWVPWSGALPTWLRLSVDENEMVHYAWSTNNVDFQEIYSNILPECNDGNSVYASSVFAGGEIPIGQSSSRWIEVFERCEP